MKSSPSLEQRSLTVLVRLRSVRRFWNHIQEAAWKKTLCQLVEGPGELDRLIHLCEHLLALAGVLQLLWCAANEVAAIDTPDDGSGMPSMLIKNGLRRQNTSNAVHSTSLGVASAMLLLTWSLVKTFTCSPDQHSVARMKSRNSTCPSTRRLVDAVLGLGINESFASQVFGRRQIGEVSFTRQRIQRFADTLLQTKRRLPCWEPALGPLHKCQAMRPLLLLRILIPCRRGRANEALRRQVRGANKAQRRCVCGRPPLL